MISIPLFVLWGISTAGRSGASANCASCPAVLQFQSVQNSSARIELIGEVTQEALDRLAKILDAQKYVFPSEKQPERHGIEPPAEQTAIEMPAPEYKRGFGKARWGQPN